MPSWPKLRCEYLRGALARQWALGFGFDIPEATTASGVMASRLRVLADTKGFSAQKFHDEGYCVIETGMGAAELSAAASSARRIAAKSSGEFIGVAGKLDMDRKRLVRVYSAVKPLIEALYGGAKHPGSDLAPYGFHNMVQIAAREPGAAGQNGIRNLRSMTSSAVAHIDQPHKRQLPRGKPICNFSCLVGILLQGETAERSDAGNLWVSPGSHILLGEAFSEMDGPPRFYTPVSKHYLSGSAASGAASMEAVRMRPGQAVIAHYQLLHASGPNKSSTARVQIYFRITAKGRPAGSAICYPAAMKDPFLEMSRLSKLMAQQIETLRVAQSLLKPLPEPASKLRDMSQKQRALAKKKGQKNRPDGPKAKAGWVRKPANKMSKKQRKAKRALEIAAAASGAHG